MTWRWRFLEHSISSSLVECVVATRWRSERGFLQCVYNMMHRFLVWDRWTTRFWWWWWWCCFCRHLKFKAKLPSAIPTDYRQGLTHLVFECVCVEAEDDMRGEILEFFMYVQRFCIICLLRCENTNTALVLAQQQPTWTLDRTLRCSVYLLDIACTSFCLANEHVSDSLTLPNQWLLCSLARWWWWWWSWSCCSPYTGKRLSIQEVDGNKLMFYAKLYHPLLAAWSSGQSRCSSWIKLTV